MHHANLFQEAVNVLMPPYLPGQARKFVHAFCEKGSEKVIKGSLVKACNGGGKQGDKDPGERRRASFGWECKRVKREFCPKDCFIASLGEILILAMPNILELCVFIFLI